MDNKTNGANALRELIYIPAHKEVSAKIRVAAYARVSSNSADQLNSFETQITYYNKAIISNPKYEFVDIYADEGISGVSLEKRTEFLRMMEDARNGKIDKILTKSLSRFSRNNLDGITSLRELKSLGVSVVFEKEGINTEKISSESLLSLYSLLAERESVSISQNCKNSIRARMSKGEYMPPSSPFGYKLVNKNLEIYEPEAEIIRRIFKQYLSGYGITAIANSLTTDKILNSNCNSNWNISSVRYILKNERYIGDMLLQKYYSEDTLPYRCRLNNGALNKYYIHDTHEPIISKIEFELVQIIMKSRLIKKPIATDYLLSKKIECSNCHVSYRRKLIKDKIYWVCRKRDNHPDFCNSELISQDAIYNAFVNLYNKLSRSSLLKEMINNLEQADYLIYKDSDDLASINLQIANLSEQNHMLTGLMSEGILDSALFMTKTDDLASKITKLKQQKAIILKNRNSNELIEKTQLLIDIFENGPKFITDIDDSLFEEIIDKITTTEKNTLNFHLINGLICTERINE
ncbi:MAG: recombinase family protein [Clostridia bacterium]